jgi:MFS superfamily sulfate permease-like transporter
MDRKTAWKFKSYLKYDLPAGLVVFLVALPLCLGIALASTGNPELLFAGIISGVVGGIVVGSISGSQLGVSGPAAGLVVIVFTAIETLGSFQAFLLAVVISGIFQFVAGNLKAGIIGYYFPSSVIKGMLAAIGIILILKEIPHALGFDPGKSAELGFHDTQSKGTYRDILSAVKHAEIGAVMLSIFSLFIILVFERPFFKRHALFKAIPGALSVVLLGIVINQLFMSAYPQWALTGHNLVQLPTPWKSGDWQQLIRLPDWNALSNPNIWGIAGALAVVASLETLLSVEATDKLDPQKRLTNTNLELKAQGIGNIVSGLIGGLPITQVIVRSSANIEAGGRTKKAAITHGFILFVAVLAIPSLLNKIPLPALATILIVIGYKLAQPSLFRSVWRQGKTEFTAFAVTIIAIVATDLLKGIFIGLTVGLFQILRQNYKNSADLKIEAKEGDKTFFRLSLPEETTILNKASIARTLRALPNGSHITIDGAKTKYIGPDVLEAISDFKQFNAPPRRIHVEVIGLLPHAAFPEL